MPNDQATTAAEAILNRAARDLELSGIDSGKVQNYLICAGFDRIMAFQCPDCAHVALDHVIELVGKARECLPERTPEEHGVH